MRPGDIRQVMPRALARGLVALLILLAGASAGAKGKKKKPKTCDGRWPYHLHEVVHGDWAWTVAGTYGVSFSDLKKWNPRDLRNPDRIRPGMKLLVCPAIAPRRRIKIDYVVKPGDTMTSIAHEHDLTLYELKRFQRKGVKDANVLRAGSRVTVWMYGEILPAFRPVDRDRGYLKRGYKLGKRQAFYIKRPERVWGTRTTVRLVESVMASYFRSNKGPRVVMGDLSKYGGGPLSGHASHQKGNDVDIGYVFRGKSRDTKTFIPASRDNLDIPRTWQLVHGFLRTGQIRYIFIAHSIQKLLYEEARRKRVPVSQLDTWFQYPRSKRRSHGIVRHWRNHHDHMHIRFRK